MSRRRVVITGMGMLSPLGLDVPSSWEGILAGRSGIAPIEHMDLSAYSTRFGGSVKGFNVEEYLSAKEARKLDLFIQYGLAASFQAVRDSGLEVTDANRERIGVSMGSGPTSRPVPAVRGTGIATASSCPTVPAPWCSKNWSTPVPAARGSMPSWLASA
nr:beta-ketoacyl synthase N-terminal-like domain-containing protein [Pseudomonas aeruginosa]